MHHTRHRVHHPASLWRRALVHTPVMYHVALDAVFAWLDAASLLAAGAVCRRWMERAGRTEAWRSRVAGVGWARGLHPRDAYLRSLRVRRRWRRCADIAVSHVGSDYRINYGMLCSDGDWLAFQSTGVRLDATSAGIGTRSVVRVYDVGRARAVAAIPVDESPLALRIAVSSSLGRCAVLSKPRNAPGACEVWAPAADGPAWRPTCRLELDSADELHWQRDMLLACRRNFHPGPMLGWGGVKAEWYDVGSGTTLAVASREYPAGRPHMVHIGDRDLLVIGSAVYALDARAPPAAEASPLTTLRSGFGAGAVAVGATGLGDGRLIAATFGDASCGALGVELWDVRAAGRDAAPVAGLRSACWYDTLCGTARGTVLGTASAPCGEHANHHDHLCQNCTVSLEEWDVARGASAPLLLGRIPDTDGKTSFVWTDERRIVVSCNGGELFVLDADTVGGT